MKKILFLIFAFSLFSCNNTQNKNNESENNFYSTKIDSTYKIEDRTEIDNITRNIYEKTIESNIYVRSLELKTKLINGKPSNYNLIKSTFNT
jgi:hypothetical protein